MCWCYRVLLFLITLIQVKLILNLDYDFISPSFSFIFFLSFFCLLFFSVCHISPLVCRVPTAHDHIITRQCFCNIINENTSLHQWTVPHTGALFWRYFTRVLLPGFFICFPKLQLYFLFSDILYFILYFVYYKTRKEICTHFWLQSQAIVTTWAIIITFSVGLHIPGFCCFNALQHMMCLIEITALTWCTASYSPLLLSIVPVSHSFYLFTVGKIKVKGTLA